jgi:hypothetical protein
VSLIFLVVAIVIFLLVGLGATLGHVDATRLVAFGLASFAAAHVAWPNWGPR